MVLAVDPGIAKITVAVADPDGVSTSDVVQQDNHFRDRRLGTDIRIEGVDSTVFRQGPDEARFATLSTRLNCAKNPVDRGKEDDGCTGPN